jgi:hypothetical protein
MTKIKTTMCILMIKLTTQQKGIPFTPWFSAAQERVASAMAKQIAGSNPRENSGRTTKFVVNLGDNFYATGVSRVDSRRFRVRELAI